jgi:G3E family GTPase
MGEGNMEQEEPYRIPVYLISGFLGAGKTTFILQLLGTKPVNEKWAIVINEFGKISIDGQILQSNSAEGSVFEISGGCICCSAKEYFREDLEKIIQENHFDRIVIEPTGLGGIDHILELVKHHQQLHLMPVVCLVDITMTSNPRLMMLPIYRAQIQKADLILLSKTELVEEQELSVKINHFKNTFQDKNIILNTLYDFRLPFGEIKPSLTKSNSWTAFYLKDHEKKADYREYSLNIPGDLFVNIQALQELFTKEKAVLRAKGYIYTGKEWVHLDYTLSGFSTEKSSPKSRSELVILYDSAEIINCQFFESQIYEAAYHPLTSFGKGDSCQ